MNEVRVSPPSTTTTVTAGSYIEWSAVFGGALTVLAVSFVLLSFGAALGLSAVSPWTTTSITATAVAGGTVVWLIPVNIWAFSLGGYLAGRMRHVWRDAAAGEVEFRDGAHGLLAHMTCIAAALEFISMAKRYSASVVPKLNGKRYCFTHPRKRVARITLHCTLKHWLEVRDELDWHLSFGTLSKHGGFF
jgi:hypothetical protein